MMRHPYVWRNLLGIAALLLAVTLSIVFVSSYLDARNGRSAAIARADRFQADLLTNQKNFAAAQARTQDELRQLSDQVIALHGIPVVTVTTPPDVPTAPVSPNRPTASPPPTAAPTTTSTTVVVPPKAPSTITTQPCMVMVGVHHCLVP